MVNCLLNPKAYAFMLAVFPAFLRSPERGLAVQALWLALIIAGNQIAIYGAVLAATLGAQRVATPGTGRWQSLLAGAMGLLLIGLAVATLWNSWPQAR